VVDGVMYLTTAWSMVKAYDVHTGAKLWEYDPKVDRAKGSDACCDVVNRGVAAWNGKIIFGSLDGRLIALDGKTGKEVWSVKTVPDAARTTPSPAARASRTARSCIGNGGTPDVDIRGNIAAFDAETGKKLWNWFAVPGDPRRSPTNSPNS